MSELRTPEVEDLLTVLSTLDDKDTIFQLLEDLFTIREIRETSQRLAVARQLDAGNSYAAIEKATGASATTIARVSKCLSYGSGGYNAARWIPPLQTSACKRANTMPLALQGTRPRSILISNNLCGDAFRFPGSLLTM